MTDTQQTNAALITKARQRLLLFDTQSSKLVRELVEALEATEAKLERLYSKRPSNNA